MSLRLAFRNYVEMAFTWRQVAAARIDSRLQEVLTLNLSDLLTGDPAILAVPALILNFVSNFSREPATRKMRRNEEEEEEHLV